MSDENKENQPVENEEENQAESVEEPVQEESPLPPSTRCSPAILSDISYQVQ